MSKTLSTLLGVDERDFSKLIQRVEQVTHHGGVDVRLTADIITKSREAVRQLGLDPQDSTYEEVYWALRSRALKSDEALREALDIPGSDTKKAFSPKKSAKGAQSIADKLNTLLIHERVISVQSAAVKKILTAVPPKKTMKLLGFRSISSVLRREDPRCLYTVALQLESESWKKQVYAQLKRLKAKDVMEQSPEIIALPESWTAKLEKTDFARVCLVASELGVVILLPTVPLSAPGTVFLTSAIALQAVETMVVESLPYRSKSLTIGLESLISEIAAGHISLLEKVHGMEPSWQAVYRLLSESERQLPEFEFVLQDLSWESSEMKLASLSSELDFWVGKHYLGYFTDGLPLSFHMIDVTVSEVLKKPWGEHVVSHMRGSLWNELQLAYLQHETFERAVVQQLTLAQQVVI